MVRLVAKNYFLVWNESVFHKNPKVLLGGFDYG